MEQTRRMVCGDNAKVEAIAATLEVLKGHKTRVLSALQALSHLCVVRSTYVATWSAFVENGSSRNILPFSED